MENLITRYRNISALVAVLFAQMLLLGVQVKRAEENKSTRLIRVWVVDAITPFEKGIVRIQGGVSGLWHGYFYLRGVRQENRDLKQQIERMQLEQVRLKDDADQARRLQSLLGFKEQFISQTQAAQVIGSSGSEHSRIIYIDKGTNDGIGRDMPVITGDGVVGKVLHVLGSTAQVLLIDDQTSGVGTILEQSRLQGVLKGTAGGEVILDKVMNDEQVQIGEKVLTSGGDEIFPKGLLVGTVAKAVHGPESFLSIQVKPAADLNRLEEVLVITKQEERAPQAPNSAPRAADILAQRLPSVPDKPAVTGGADGEGSKGQNGGIAEPQPSQPAASQPGVATGEAVSATKSSTASDARSSEPKLPAPAVKPPATKPQPQTDSAQPQSAQPQPALLQVPPQ